MTTLPLPSNLDTAAATPLRATLAEQVEGGRPLLLDGGEVAQAGQACLQVLVAARAAARAAGLPFRIERPSPALAEMADLAALDLLDQA